MPKYNMRRWKKFSGAEQAAVAVGLTHLAFSLVDAHKDDPEAMPKSELAARYIEISRMVSEINVFQGGDPVNGELMARLALAAQAIEKVEPEA